MGPALGKPVRRRSGSRRRRARPQGQAREERQDERPEPLSGRFRAAGRLSVQQAGFDTAGRVSAQQTAFCARSIAGTDAERRGARRHAPPDRRTPHTRPRAAPKSHRRPNIPHNPNNKRYGIHFLTHHRRRDPVLQSRRGRTLLRISRHQSARPGAHAGRTETGGRLPVRSRRRDAGGHDALRQAGRRQNPPRNSVQKGSGGRSGARSTPCAHPSDPHQQRNRRRFPPRKAQINSRRVPRNRRTSVQIGERQSKTQKSVFKCAA